jgi:hypothetical protein
MFSYVLSAENALPHEPMTMPNSEAPFSYPNSFNLHSDVFAYLGQPALIDAVLDVPLGVIYGVAFDPPLDDTIPVENGATLGNMIGIITEYIELGDFRCL